ncbi:type III-A CRISPR-associated protein Cas10/Csm1 [Pectinatus brassicae]|uniref:CRISPR system single-strand-specific deoxyribonuclease Cas10/Csm1 (subtype III-A) n=1 Tax=Pectinatus brassicae TaxID=862415 RepID=A0A840UEE7_9FIRM|nr:type III-A CRISPR-associated protein Cas10/Csm1 [Pectinatus brassicae]MBB5335486.1 CRISPR-associated protein Csm1 [Pectinatus brassicae]
MRNIEKLHKITLAALLHDCGKIVYRSNDIKRTHSLLGTELLMKYCNDKEILQAVKYHHGKALAQAKLANDNIAYIVYEADNIAAGFDRRDEEGADIKTGFNKYVPLESVFNHLQGSCPDTDKAYHYLRGLAQGEKINYGIRASDNKIQASRDNYAKLLNYFEENLQSLMIKNGKIAKDNFINAGAAQLLKIIEAICSYMPSSTMQKQATDISLYDHVKLTAAIANAMYLYFAENNIIDYKKACFKNNKDYRQKDMFLLVSGDMSGIQDFIYTIANAGALKSLRGRSFYLDMVLEYLADEILQELGLNRCNLIYTGGGHFYLLAANTQTVKDKIAQMKNKCNEWFLQKTGTTLYLELGWQECSAVNFMVPDNAVADTEEYEQIGELFRKLSSKLSKQKLCRYNKQQLIKMFDPQSAINKTRDGIRECGICHTSTAVLADFHGSNDGNTKACILCNKLYDFGREIIAEDKTIFVVLNDNKGLPLPSWDNECSLHIMDKKCLADYDENKIKHLYTKNVLETGNRLATNLWVGDYIVHKLEQENSKYLQIADFEYLAEQSQGIKRLGVLRADVDRLGQTFATAFRDENGTHYLTLSRIAALSRQLSLFFKKYINSICKGNIAGENELDKPLFSLWNNKKNGRQLAIVYSGGDDVFVVGAWDEVLEFAVDLYQTLNHFSNGKITISAGMAMLEHNYPISQMANIAGQLESLAKDSGRNRIALLDNIEQMWADIKGKNKQPVHCYEWPVFIDEVVGEKILFLKKHFKFNTEMEEAVLGQGHLPIGKGQLYRLLEFLREKINGSEENQDKPQRMNIARFIYWLARLQPDKKDIAADADYQKVRGKLYDWLTEKDWQNSRQLLTALVLIIYGLRDKNKEMDNGGKENGTKYIRRS